jgi:hypothetical protein
MARLLALVLLAGCTPTAFAFSPIVNGTTPKPDDCAVEILTSPPSRDYQEIGTLDYYNGPEPKTVESFKKAVSQQVCRAGGTAVIATVDDKGQFSKGTVIAYTGYGAPGPAPKGTKGAAPPEQQTDTELPKK